METDPSGKQRIVITHFGDTFEIIVSKNIIVRVTKFIGESGMSRECPYARLPAEVKQSLHHILDNYE
jgi:hypothetical protein